MKNILFLLVVTLPFMSSAQSQADYEHTVAKFMKFYNANQPDSICSQYSDEWGEAKKTLWTKEKTDDIKKRYGKMISYKFLDLYNDGTGDGGGSGLAFFKTKFEKSTHIMGITLNKKNELLTFRFKTTSPHIDSLLAANK